MHIDHFIGAFNMGTSKYFKKEVKKRLAKSIFGRNEISILIENDSLMLVSSGNNIDIISDDNIVITYIGNIIDYLVPIPKDYNPKDNLRIMCYLYKNYGNGFAKHINGHFIIILWDISKNKLLLVQDKFPGIKTLFWLKKENVIIFSNYIKPLLALNPEYINKINEKALYQYMAYSRICAPDTIFRDIHQVEAGEAIEIRDGNIKKDLYDPWKFSRERIRDKDEAIRRYEELLTVSIGSMRDIHAPCGFLSSGGLDSGVVVALAAKQAREELITICVGAHKYNTDAPYARMLSKIYNTKHYEYIVHGPEINNLPQIIWQMENPHYEPGVILVYCAQKCAKNYVNSIIGGDIADQIYGYTSASDAYKRYRINNSTYGLFRLLQISVRQSCRNRITDSIPLFSKIENRLIGRYDVNRWAGKFGFRDCDLKRMLRKRYYFEERINNIDVPEKNYDELLEFIHTTVVRDYAVYGILFRNGRISDLLGIKYYTPFTDKNIFNFVMSLDHSLRTPLMDNSRRKYKSKYLHTELAKKLLPHDLINRRKQGGAINPYIHLEDEKRYNAIKNIIVKSDYLNELFDMNYIRKLFNAQKSSALLIMLLLTLDLWHYIYTRNDILNIPDFTLDDYLNNNAI